MATIVSNKTNDVYRILWDFSKKSILVIKYQLLALNLLALVLMLVFYHFSPLFNLNSLRIAICS
jgi:hypothetical protein